MTTPSPVELARMRSKSGGVVDDRPLVRFLYLLVRDHLPPGQLEQIMCDNNLDVYGTQECVFTNGWLAAYAQDITERLLGPSHAESETVPGD